MNICLLNDSFPPVIDGVANVVLNYAKNIHGSLGSVMVVTPSYPGASDDYPFPVLRYPSLKTPRTAGYRAGLPFPVKTVKDIARWKPDIIHCHCPLVSGVLARSLRTETGAPIIFTYHTKFDIDIANIINLDALRFAAGKVIVSNVNACDEVWAVSRGAGENLRGLGYKGGYRIMENGVDFPKGRASDKAVAALYKELGLDPAVPVFLFVGRMMWYKGLRLIIDGLFRAKAAGVKFNMVFVGGGKDFGEIASYVHMLNMRGECIFAGSIKDREKLRTYFSLADMFLFPSTFDTSGIVVREAAACGLASVLVKGSAAAEGIRGGRNGVLIEENAAALAEVIARFAKNRGLAREFGRRAMEELYFTWEDSVALAYARYQEIYTKHVAVNEARGYMRHNSARSIIHRISRGS